MSTTTLFPLEQKLVDEFGPRRGQVALRLWQHFFRDGSGGEGTVSTAWNSLDAAVGNLTTDLFDYLPWNDNEPDVRPSEMHWADGVLDEMRSAALEAAVQAAIRELMADLPTAPRSLRSHPGAEQLRADLALLDQRSSR